MNSLEKFIYERGWNEIKAMNCLMNSGLISDNCVLARDVAGADCFKACQFLLDNYQEKEKK